MHPSQLPPRQEPNGPESKFKIAESFNNRTQQAGFLAVLLLTLCWPLIESICMPLAPGEVYKIIPSRSSYRFIGETIEKGGDVDVLFVGGSDIWTAADPKTIEAGLKERLKREVRVLNFGNNWSGFESYYARVHEVLQTTRVKLIVFPHQESSQTFHALVKYVWRSGQIPMPKDFSLRERLSLYAVSIIGAPIRAWSHLRGVDNVTLTKGGRAYLAAFPKTNGALMTPRGFRSLSLPKGEKGSPYRGPSHPPPNLTAHDLLVTPNNVRFRHLDRPYSTYQTAALNATFELARQHQAKFAMVSLPIIFSDRPLEKAMIRSLANGQETPWPEFGVAMADLFDGLTFEQMKDFYANERHLNPAGAQAFSRVIVPALAELLE